MSSNRFSSRAFARAVLLSSIISLGVAATMTGLDWRKNPEGLFHGPGGTDWVIVRETFFSWFWPLLPLVGIVGVLGAVALHSLRSRRAQ
jgi:hypothetical protein